MKKVKLVLLYAFVYILCVSGLLGVFYWKSQEIRWDLLLIFTLAFFIVDTIMRQKEKSGMPDNDERVIYLIKAYTRKILTFSFVLLGIGLIVYENVAKQSMIPISYLTIYLLVTSSVIMIAQFVVRYR